MVTLQDIGHRFMKPVKELADWKFPLSQILEEYYALMNQPCSINFGEAAFVIQNSTDVYIQRIDRLTDETSRLNITFIEQEAEQASETSKHGKRNRNKTSIDLNDFKPVIFDEEVSRNINIKNRSDQKPVKLISQRFTQLEGDAAKLPIDIVDIHREIIGKKYDFRCNQQLSINGVLVDELTPKDFDCTTFKQHTSLDTGLDTTRSSGYSSYISQFDNNSNFGGSNTERDISTNITEAIEHNKDATEDSDYTFIGSDAVFTDTIKDTSIHNMDVNSIVELSINDNGTLISSQKDNDSSQETLQGLEIRINDNNRNMKLSNSVEEVNTSKRRSQRVKNMTLTVDSINEKLWEPLPLTQSAPTVKVEKFKLPCTGCSVKSKSETKKRKFVSKAKKRESLLKLLLIENKSLQKNNVPRFLSELTVPSLKKEEIDEFENEFNNCLKKTESMDEFHCKAMRTISMDLLEGPSYYDERSLSDISNSSYDDSINNNISSDTLPYSPINTTFESCSPRDEPVEANSQHSMPDYNRIVVDKMKEIFQESNVRTELETSVAKWHESLQPKLVDAEQRSTFHLQDYMKHIVKSLRLTKERRLKFNNVVLGKPATEVARYFLAMLQLANAYNVELNTNQVNNCDIELVLRNPENTSDS